MHNSRVNPNDNCGWSNKDVNIGSFYCNECTTLKEDVDTGGSYSCEGMYFRENLYIFSY
jgi:hypothetical protein